MTSPTRTRTTRAEQVGLNRERLLDAAREVFMANGFHAASLDQIAERAGFSKGVVYSQFDSKADLFLTLLERRIEERARDNAASAGRATSVDDVGRLVDGWIRTQRTDTAWTLLVLEFRIHASRHPAVQERYARAHDRTIDGLATMLRTIYDRLAIRPPDDVRELALLVFAMGNGATVEHSLDPRHPSLAVSRRACLRLLGLEPTDRSAP